MKRSLILMFMLTASLIAVGQETPTKPYIITGFRQVKVDGRGRYEYTVKHGSNILRVYYSESQIGISKADWDATVSKGERHIPLLHFYFDRDEGGLSQIPEVGTSIPACVLGHLSNGEKSIAIQPTPQPCMDQQENRLTYLPFPNGPRLFDYVKFEVISERVATK